MKSLFQKLINRFIDKPAPFVKVSYINPRQTVLLTAAHNDEKNVWPIDWHTPLSFDPPLYGISLNKEGYGSRLIQQSQQFIIHFVPDSWHDLIYYCGKTSGRNVDKFKECEITTSSASTVQAPVLTRAIGYLECRQTQMHKVGDHYFIVGEVTHENLNKKRDTSRLYHIYRRMIE